MNRNVRRTAVVVTDVPFWERSRGSHRRIEALAAEIARQADVEFFLVSRLSPQQWVQAELRSPYSLRGPARPGRLARMLQLAARKRGDVGNVPRANTMDASAGPPPTRLKDFRSVTIGNALARYLAKRPPAALIIEYITLAYLIDFIPRTLRERMVVAIDTHDVLSQRQAAFERQALPNWIEVTGPEETRAILASDLVIAIQEHDAELFRKLLAAHAADRPARPRVIVAKHPMIYTPPVQRMEPKPIRIGYVAAAGVANRAAIEAFLTNVWPLLRQRLADNIQLVIAGPICEDLPASPATNGQIELRRQLDLGTEFYPSLEIAINPATVVSGLKIKSLEALSFGVPLVTTTAGQIGLEAGRDRCFLVADDWREFAECIVRLATDESLRREFAGQTEQFIRSRFSPDVVFADLRRQLFGDRA